MSLHRHEPSQILEPVLDDSDLRYCRGIAADVLDHQEPAVGRLVVPPTQLAHAPSTEIAPIDQLRRGTVAPGAAPSIDTHRQQRAVLRDEEHLVTLRAHSGREPPVVESCLNGALSLRNGRT
jgi:hypothetical protein